MGATAPKQARRSPRLSSALRPRKTAATDGQHAGPQTIFSQQNLCEIINFTFLNVNRFLCDSQFFSKNLETAFFPVTSVQFSKPEICSGQHGIRTRKTTSATSAQTPKQRRGIAKSILRLHATVCSPCVSTGHRGNTWTYSKHSKSVEATTGKLKTTASLPTLNQASPAPPV